MPANVAVSLGFRTPMNSQRRSPLVAAGMVCPGIGGRTPALPAASVGLDPKPTLSHLQNILDVTIQSRRRHQRAGPEDKSGGLETWCARGGAIRPLDQNIHFGAGDGPSIGEGVRYFDGYPVQHAGAVRRRPDAQAGRFRRCATVSARPGRNTGNVIPHVLKQAAASGCRRGGRRRRRGRGRYRPFRSAVHRARRCRAARPGGRGGTPRRLPARRPAP